VCLWGLTQYMDIPVNGTLRSQTLDMILEPNTSVLILPQHLCTSRRVSVFHPLTIDMTIDGPGSLLAQAHQEIAECLHHFFDRLLSNTFRFA
jgi:hypothetical protein